jgi:NADPH:quinone reductase-like Zn-dependent oxidoreductase
MRDYEIRDTQGIDSIVLGERAAPAVGTHDVLIRVKAVSLNRSDLSVTRGAYSRNTPLPLILCSDGVGEVVQTGANVTRFQIGDRVARMFMPMWIDGPLSESMTRQAIGRTVDGMLAEFVAADEHTVVSIPEFLTDEEAATLPTAAVTAWNGLGDGGLKPGESVLTLGTGGVSIFALQFAVACGARVIATSGSPDKLDRLRAIGARDLIDYRSVPDWGKQVRDLTDGGVHWIVEVIGAATLEQSIRAVRVGGRISLIGALGGAGEVNPIPIVMKAITLQGIYVGSREMFERMNTFITMKRLKPVIDQIYDFDHAIEAFRHLESGRHFGKICIRIAK